MPRIAAKESDVDDLKELLPLAARACGYGEVWYLDGYDTPHIGPRCELANPAQYRPWNPLTPGDGAEMEDKLRISVHRIPGGVSSGLRLAEDDWAHVAQEHYANHPDEGTARRWASLRVAAAIGRSMK
jgi:hypothetical protein